RSRRAVRCERAADRQLGRLSGGVSEDARAVGSARNRRARGARGGAREGGGRRHVLRFARLIALALLVAACHREKSHEHAPVILISIDTLRADHLPAYGYKNVATPHIDALRRDAILFDDAWSHCPMTLPSHVSMLTGLLPTDHEVRNNLGYRFDAVKHPTLPKVLKQQGNATGAAVSSYVLRADTGLGGAFDWYDDAIPVATSGAASQHQRPGSATLEVAKKWIGEHQAQ